MYRIWVAVGLLMVASVAAAVAPSCPDGTFTSDECVRQLRELDKQLAAIYADKERWIRQQYAPSDSSAAQENVQYFRQANASWKAYRVNECLSSALSDGMSPQSANDVAKACEVAYTKERIRRFMGENWRKRP